MIYVNAISSMSAMQHDIRELIPNAMQRRRMSEIVRYGVAVGMECVMNASEGPDATAPQLDAIITATGFGCLSDSEKFLDSIVASDEQLLSPTPFIQSTFNTIGGQLAIMLGSHAYNVTYSQRALSFESALIDASMQIEQGEARNVLVGAFDINTPTLRKLMGRLRMDVASRRDGVFFFLLSSVRSDASIAALQVSLDSDPARQSVPSLSSAGDVVVNDVCYEISSAAALFEALSSHRVPCSIINRSGCNINSIIRIGLC